MWKLKIYYLGQAIKTIKIKDDERIFDNVYPIKVWFKYHIFKTIMAEIIVEPIAHLLQDNENKTWHVEVVLSKGVRK